MEGMNWFAVASGVLGILVIIFSVKWAQVKALLKEVAEAFVVVSSAVEDDKITREELQKIVDEWHDVLLAVLKLIGKA